MRNKVLLSAILFMSFFANSVAQTDTSDFGRDIRHVYDSNQSKFQRGINRFVRNAAWPSGNSLEYGNIKYVPIFEIYMKKKCRNMFYSCSPIPSERFDSLLLYLNPKSMELSQVLVFNGSSLEYVIQRKYDNRNEWPVIRVSDNKMYLSIAQHLNASQPLFCCYACQGSILFLVNQDDIICLAKPYGSSEYVECNISDLKNIFLDMDCFDVNALFRQTKHSPNIYVR